MKRSAVTGIRIKDDVYQQLIAYHQENYPDTPFVASHIILELIQKGLGNNVKQDVKQNVKQDDEYVTRQDFDTFKDGVTQKINELNSLLNDSQKTIKNETQTIENETQPIKNETPEWVVPTEKLKDMDFEVVMSPVDIDDNDNETLDKSYSAAIAIAKEKIIKGENLESIEKFLSENEYQGKQGKPIKWATRLSKIPAIKALREKTENTKNKL